MIQVDLINNSDEFFSTTLPTWYDTSDKDNFPGYLGGNHAGINTRGPLKDDWTKACPVEWTQEERDEKCISLQEAIWGTKTLSRLEAIKEVIDPDYMFDCNGAYKQVSFFREFTILMFIILIPCPNDVLVSFRMCRQQSSKR